MGGKNGLDVASPAGGWGGTTRASNYGLSHQLAGLSISTGATPVATPAAEHRGGISPSYTNYSQHYNYRVAEAATPYGMPQTPHTPQGLGFNDQQWPITPQDSSGSGLNWGWAQ